jgi:predicted RNase H-like HicB family nuclease
MQLIQHRLKVLKTEIKLTNNVHHGNNTTMITYTAAYTFEDEVCLGEVLDFPGAVCFGNTLEEARTNLSAALLDMAETNLSLSEPLPKPVSTIKKPRADIIEPISVPVSLRRLR